MFNLMEKMYSEFSSFKNDLTSVKEGVKSLNVKVDKNTLELESINSKIGILAEVQRNLHNKI